MPRFRFRLQAVLNAAEHSEQQVRRAFAQAQTAEEAARRRLDSIASALSEWENQIRAQQRGELVVSALRGQIGAARALRKRLVGEREVLRQASRNREAVQARLVEATRRRRSLEILRDRLRASHEAEESARRTKATDDLVNTRHALNQAQGPSTVTGASL